MPDKRQDPGTPIPGEQELQIGERDESSSDEGADQGDGSGETQPSAAETSAREKGWRPEGEYEGPSGSWVTAEEFLKREPFFEKIKGQSKQIKNLQKTIDALVSQTQTQVKAQVELKLKELKREKSQAIAIGDEDRVDEIDAEIDQHKKEVKEEPAKVPDEVSDWIEKNPWFRTEKEMNRFAIAHNRTYIEDNPGEIEQSLKETEKAVKKAFPEFFQKAKVDGGKERTPPNPVEAAGSGQAAPKKGYNMSRLNSEQKLVYEQYVKRHKIMSHEEYFSSLDEAGELS
jgi:hypothetical protein